MTSRCIRSNVKRMLAVLCVLSLCIVVTACAPQRASSGSADTSSEQQAGGNAQVSFTWSAESDCATCHTTEADSLQNAACQISASHGALACVACHDQEDLGSVHDGVELGESAKVKKLKNTEVRDELCLSCHADDHTPEAIADDMMLVDDQGTTVNPHALPESASHATVTCANCHTMHGDAPLLESASDACVDCHHQNVYECYTCHE